MVSDMDGAIGDEEQAAPGSDGSAESSVPIALVSGPGAAEGYRQVMFQAVTKRPELLQADLVSCPSKLRFVIVGRLYIMMMFEDLNLTDSVKGDNHKLRTMAIKHHKAHIERS